MQINHDNISNAFGGLAVQGLLLSLLLLLSEAPGSC